MTKQATSLLSSNSDNTEHDVYKRQRSERRTVGETSECSHYASVVSNGEPRVKLHSKVSKHIEAPPPATFLDTLNYFTNQKMWDSMHLENN